MDTNTNTDPTNASSDNQNRMMASDDDVFNADWDIDDTQQDQGVHVIDVEGLGKAQVTFADFETIEEMQQPGEGEIGLSAEMICTLVKRHFVTPSFEQLTPEKVRSMKPTIPPRLLDALMNDDVDVEMNSDGSATVSAGGN